MQCLKCGKANAEHYAFCLSCGARMPHQAAGEPGGGGAQATGSQGPRCAQCGSTRAIQGAIGPQMGVRVLTAAGRQEDLPIAMAWVCIDCGHVATYLPENARQYLASVAGR
jgi:DNA-directed RNA polymerase subunit RPC12/RpoP